MMSKRHLARVIAMQAIFVLLQRERLSIDETINYLLSEREENKISTDFIQEIVHGALENKDFILEKIVKFTKEKSVAKIDNLTIAILAVGIFELCLAKNKQPVPVVINEAIELAKEYAKDSAPALVNAILSKVSEEKS